MNNKRYNIHQILTYLKNKLTIEERYSLEKDMNADPFLSDAMDGFAKLSADELSADLAQLEEQLNNRVEKRKPRSLIVYWGVAASVVLLISVGALYFITSNTEVQKFQVAQEVRVKPAPETVKSKAIVAKEEADKKDVLLETAQVAEEVIPAPAAPSIAQAKTTNETLVTPKGIVAEEKMMLLKGEEPIAAPVQSHVLMDEQAPLMANNYQVKGIVEDNDGPIPGVSVYIKGTDTGTITDMDGAYQIDAKEGDVLVYAFIGYEQREEEVTQNVLAKADVQLKEANVSLDEVVAIGYGVRTKKEVTGAITQIKTKEEENISVTSLQTYIDNNKKIDANNTIVVEAEFSINKRGKVKDIKILTTNSDAVKKEAKRLLTNAPVELLSGGKVSFNL